MFNNRFNNRNADPLVEAVKAAQADGEMRRQAIAQVNEAFGVYNRNAVIRENLAAYDAAIEEAYKCMKEGEKWEGSKEDKDEDKKLAKKHGMTMKQWEKSEADKKHDAKEKDDDKDDEDDKKEKMDEKKMWEAKKLAAKDYDKDGKIESPKDEVWGSRFRAAKLAGKMEEGSMDSDVVGGGAVTKDNKPVVSSTAPKADTSGPSASEKSALASKIKAMNEERKRTASVADAFMKGQKANQRTLRTDGKSVTYHGNTIAKHEGDEVHVTTAGHSHSPSTRGHINGILSRLGSEKLSVKKGQLHHGKNPVDHDAWIKVKKSTVSEESIDEAAYSAKAAREGKDIGKPGKMFSKIAKKAGERYGSEERGKKVAGAVLAKIRAKHMKEDSSFNAAQDSGKTVSEIAMTTPPAIVQPAVPAAKQTQTVRPTASFGRQGAGARPLTPTTQSVSSSMKSPSFMSTSKLSSAASKVADGASKAATVASRAPGVASRVAGIAARAMGGPIAGAAMLGGGASELVGKLATGTETGRAIGKSIGRAINPPVSTLPKSEPAATPKPTSVGIKKGDTMTSIAKAQGTTVSDLAKANPDIKDVNKISAGKSLNVPATTPKPPAAPKALGGTKWSDQGAKERSSAASTQASTMKAAGDTPSVQTGTAAPKDAPMPPRRPETTSASTAAPMQNPDQNITKEVPTIKAPETPAKVNVAPEKSAQNPDQERTKVMKESVQVGSNYYRIV